MRETLTEFIYMPVEDLRKNFNGKWIFLVNCIMGEGNTLLGGIPVAQADVPFENGVDKFFEQFKDSKFAPRCDANYLYGYENIHPQFEVG